MEREWLECLAITFLGEPQNCRELNCDTVRFDIPISSSKTNSLIWSYWKSDKKSAVALCLDGFTPDLPFQLDSAVSTVRVPPRAPY